jgi:hypothetical protein
MKSPNRKPGIVTVRGTGHVEIDLPSVPGFDGFRKLRQYLQNEHGAVVKECVEGPDACKCVLSLQSQVCFESTEY